MASSFSGLPSSLTLGRNSGLMSMLQDDPFFMAKDMASKAGEAGDITRDIFSGIFGEGGTDFGSIATGLLEKMQGVGQAERDVAFKGIDEEAGRATENLSNRLGQFGNMDPEQFSRVASDVDVGRMRARGEAEANFAGMDRNMLMGMLQSMGPLMNAQQNQQSDFGGVAMNILKSAPTFPGGNTGIGTGPINKSPSIRRF